MHHAAAKAALVAASSFCVTAAALGAAAAGVPPPLVHSAAQIAATQARARAGDPAVLAAIAAAVRAAEAALPLGPWSVTQCPHVPPDGDRRSYYSIAKYYWPCNAAPCAARPPSCSPDGLPWVDCDGLVNPATDAYALPRVANMTAAVSLLAQGYLWSGNATFAARAAALLRTFFLDPALGMHPHLAFAQAEPGSNNGSHWGVIELSGNFVADVLDAIAFIAPSGAWTAQDQSAWLVWLEAMGAWLRASGLGAQEAVAFNNHQIWYAGMLAGIDVWTGSLHAAVALLRGTLEPPPAGNANAPLGMQIGPDGQLPAEEARTNSGGYVNFATSGLLQLGEIARTPALVAAGAPDLLTYVTRSNHSGVQAAVDFMVPYVRGEAPWPFQNITGTPWATYTEEYLRAANTAGWDSRRAVYSGVVTQLRPKADDPRQLFWPLAGPGRSA